MNKHPTDTTDSFIWVFSGQAPTGISVAIVDTSAATVVTSASMTSSGNGHYYQVLTYPSTPGLYTVEWKATINGKPYRNFERIRCVKGYSD